MSDPVKARAVIDDYICTVTGMTRNRLIVLACAAPIKYVIAKVAELSEETREFYG